MCCTTTRRRRSQTVSITQRARKRAEVKTAWPSSWVLYSNNQGQRRPEIRRRIRCWVRGGSCAATACQWRSFGWITPGSLTTQESIRSSTEINCNKYCQVNNSFYWNIIMNWNTETFQTVWVDPPSPRDSMGSNWLHYNLLVYLIPFYHLNTFQNIFCVYWYLNQPVILCYPRQSVLFKYKFSIQWSEWLKYCQI